MKKQIFLFVGLFIWICLFAVWDNEEKEIASDGAAYDSFGHAVAVSGAYAVIGAPGDDDMGDDTGSAYIFHRTGTTWSQQQKIDGPWGSVDQQFGCSVSIDGDYALIGAYQDDVYVGSAYVYHRSGTTWSLQQKLIPSVGYMGDYFGWSVSINGDYALIGALHDNYTLIGAAYIFHRNGTTWTQQQKLTASDGAASDNFANSVSLDGEYALIGASGDDDLGANSGSAYLFKRTGTVWTEHTKLHALDGFEYDEFGISVSISQDKALIGAWDDDDFGYSSGSAYIFYRTGETWSHLVKLVPNDGAAYDRFGYSVCISGNYKLVGAYADDDNTGSVYLFNSWLAQTKLTASDAAVDDNFGNAVSISNNYALIGSFCDDDNGYSSGSVYFYSETLLLPPQNVQIEIIGNNVHISWDEILNQTFTVYSSADPYNGFFEDFTGTYGAFSWTAPLNSNKKFYYVTATPL